MDQLNVTLTPAMLAMVPIIATILQLLKRIEPLGNLKQWFPILSVGLSLGLGYVTNMPNPIVSSIIIGLVASGGYDVLKSPTKAP